MRGVAASERRQGNLTLLETCRPDDGRRLLLRVKTRTSGTWQGSVRDGDPSPGMASPEVFWVFVGIERGGPPGFFIVPDQWMRRDIYEAHQKYLNRHGRIRAITSDSTHHAIERKRILQWQDRWELLGIHSELCLSFANEPFALKDAAERKRRAAMLSLPHVQPLAAYLRRVKDAQGAGYEMPYFDPCDGGVRAKALFLLEAPGPKAVGSAFVSRNNPDQTARNINELLRKAGLPREDTLLWNIVPWYVGEGRKIRAVTSEDIEEACPYLVELIGLLPDLRAIVLVGEKAKSARGTIQRLTKARIFDAPHPSPKVFNIWPEKREKMQEVLNALAAFLQGFPMPAVP